MYSPDRRRFSRESKSEGRPQAQPTSFDSWDDPVEAFKNLKKLGLGAIRMAARFAGRVLDSLPKDPPRASSIE
jgi:hypothetical protein